ADKLGCGAKLILRRAMSTGVPVPISIIPREVFGCVPTMQSSTDRSLQLTIDRKPLVLSDPVSPLILTRAFWTTDPPTLQPKFALPDTSTSWMVRSELP